MIAAVKKLWVIAFEFPPFPGGQATYAVEMARAYHAMGYQVTVIAPDYAPHHPAATIEPDAAEPYSIQRLLVHQQLNHQAILAVVHALRDVLPDDIVLACDIRSGLATSVARLLYRFRKIVMFHGGEIVRAEYSRFAWLGNWLAAFGACKLVANSQFSAALVKKHLHKPCAGIALGVARSWLAAPVRTQFDSPILAALPTNVPWLSTVARLARRKGHLVACDALQWMQKAGDTPYLYIIAGKMIDPEYFAELETVIAAANGRVVYVGQISQHDVHLLYARSAVFLLLASHEKGDVEGFGLVITESGAQGCPAVSTKVGGIPDAIVDGKTGLLCGEGDVPAMAHAIRTIVTQPDYRRSLGQAARDYAAELSWERNARLTLDGVT